MVADGLFIPVAMPLLADEVAVAVVGSLEGIADGIPDEEGFLIADGGGILDDEPAAPPAAPFCVC